MLYEYVEPRVISSILVCENDNHLFDVFSSISVDDFEKKEHKVLFSVLESLFTVKGRIVFDDVVFELEKQGQLEQIGGVGVLQSYYEDGYHNIVTSSLLESARVLKEHSTKRLTKVRLESYAKNVFVEDSGKDSRNAIDQLVNELNDISYSNIGQADSVFSINLRDAGQKYKDLLRVRGEISSSNETVGVPTLIPKLDEVTNGWLPGQVISVGARSSVGKSAFAINCAMSAAKSGRSVLFFSLEMNEEELLDRVYSSSSFIPMYKFKKGISDKGDSWLCDKDKKVLFDTIKDVESLNLQFETNPSLSISDIRSIAKRFQREHGLDFVIIDYLQLITPSIKANSRQEVVQDISRNVKLLAKELQIPVMVLVQLNREKSIVNKNGEHVDQLPAMHDIRESGAIANDSDVVVLIHRNFSSDQDCLAKLIVAKNRNGRRGDIIECVAQLECSLFLQASVCTEQVLQDNSIDDYIDSVEDVFSDLDDITDSVENDGFIDSSVSLSDTVDMISSGDGVDLGEGEWW